MTTQPPSNTWRLLRYVDPYGDTVFNRLQASDVLADVDLLRRGETRDEGLVFLESLRQLAQRSRDDGYLLRFYGD